MRVISVSSMKTPFQSPLGGITDPKAGKINLIGPVRSLKVQSDFDKTMGSKRAEL